MANQSNRNSPPDIRKLLNRILIIPIALAVALILISIFEATYLRIDEWWIEHSIAVIARAHELRTASSDAQVYFLGYWTGGPEELLDASLKARRRFTAHYKALKDFGFDNPGQIEDVRAIQVSFDEWEEFVRQQQPLRLSAGAHPEHLNHFLKESVELRAGMARALDEFIKMERDVRDRRMAQTKSLAFLLFSTIGVLIIVLVGVAITARRALVDVSRIYGQALDSEKLSREKSEQAIATRDEFLSLASHELRNPLTSLRLQLQLMARDLRSRQLSETDHLWASLTLCLRQIASLDSLVDDLLDTTRIQAGKFTLNLEAVDLCAVAKDVVFRFSEQAREAHSPIHMEACRPLVGQWDFRRLEQIAANLISNAIKYAPGNRITVRADRANGTATLTVEDLGPGIAKEMQQRIFERFERADRTGNISGMGLGLYIVRGIVESMGGQVHVESQIGKGSKFVVSLPISSPQQLVSAQAHLTP